MLSGIICDLRGGIVELSAACFAKKPAPAPLLFCYLPSASKSRPIDLSGDCDCKLAFITCISCVSELLLG